MKLAIFGNFGDFCEFLAIFASFGGRLQKKKQANGHAFSPTRVQVNWSLYLRGKGGNPGVVLGGGDEQKRAFWEFASLISDFCSFSADQGPSK